jgi:transcriptional regulator with XRE-family HTH domain
MRHLYPFDCLAVHPKPEELETLSSYMIRLAEANGIQSISDLRRLLAPKQHFRPHLRGNMADLYMQDFPDLARAANCTVDQVRQTTFFHLVVKFQSRQPDHLLRDSLAPVLRFCPACLREAPYYRLDWRFLTLPGCHHHQCNLLDCCWHCHQTIPLLSHDLVMARCPHCHADLSAGQACDLTATEYTLTQQRATELKYLLIPQSWESNALEIRKGACAWLRVLRQEQGITVPAMAQEIGISVHTLRYLEFAQVERSNCPFEVYLALTDYLQTTWASVFEMFYQQPDELPHDALSLRDRRLRQQMEKGLRELEETGEPFSKMALSRKVNLSPECFALYPQVQALIDTLPEREQQRRVAQLLADVQSALIQLQQQGQAVTHHAIRKRVKSFPASLVVYPQVLEILLPYIAYRQLVPQSRKEVHPNQAEIIAKIPDVVQGVMASGDKVTIIHLANALGVPKLTIYRYPDLYQHVKQASVHYRKIQEAQKDAELAQRVQQVIAHFTECGRHFTRSDVCAEVGKPYHILARYPRTHALLLEIKKVRHGQRSP